MRGLVMKFEIYCDEANPDVFTSKKPRVKYLMIGSLWLPAESRENIKKNILTLREKHDVWGEIKWSKVSPNQQEFYLKLAELFMHEENLRFRCIAVDHTQLNMSLHNNDGELGFYKFYYQLLHHWILDFNEYRIFCDAKTNRDPKRLPVLARCLSLASMSSEIISIQSLPSQEVDLIQLCDLLLGSASSRINETLNPETAKAHFVHRLETILGRKLSPTHKNEEKFNIFKIRLQGGW